MVKSSLPDDDGSGRAGENKRMRCSIQPASTPQPNPCPTGEVRGKLGQPEEGDSSKSVVSLILSDRDVLHCPICLDPLTSPVFQCVDGHIACSSCCGKLENKCPSCRKEIGRIRCRAIEKVIDSVKINCCYADYGCKALVSWLWSDSGA
ncbi:hypothetical protein Dimus_023192 [Dionaea muscipula]